MKIYFLSSLPCALVVGGAYFGKTDTFPRQAEVCAKDELLVEFRPENALPITFFLTEKLAFSPPDKCEVYILPDGIAVYAKQFIPCDFTLRHILQRSSPLGTITVFQQGSIQVCLETQKGSFIKALPPCFCPTEGQIEENFCLLTSPTAFCLLDDSGNTLLHEPCESIHLEGDVLTAILPLQDSKQRKAKVVWRIGKEGCTQEEFSLLQPAQLDHEGLIAYAFFESVLLHADFLPFLAPRLQNEADKLLAFLGDFIAVLPQDDEKSCGLVYQKAERLYQVDIYRVTIQDGKIVDIEK